MRGKWLIFIGIIISQVLTAVAMVTYLTKVLFPASVADSVLVLCEGWNIGLILGNAMVLLAFFDMKDSFNATAVLMYASKKKVLARQIKAILADSLVISIIVTASALFWGNLVFRQGINWDSGYSFFAINFGQTVDNVSLWNVLLQAFVGIFIYMMIIGLYCIVTRWYGVNVIWVFVFVTADCIIERALGVRVILNSMIVRHTLWIDPINYLLPISTAVALCIMAYILLRRGLREKEFM